MCVTNPKAFLEDATIVSHKTLADGYYLMTVKSEKIAGMAEAGQFCMIKPVNGIRILRRPISIHGIDIEAGTLEFYYETIGEGTKEIAMLEVGETINLQGPLGVGFDTSIEGKTVAVVGGGMGIAPVKQLVNDLKKKNSVTFIAGGRNEIHLNILENCPKDVETLMATDDGTKGIKGNTVDLLKQLISEKKIDRVYTCGPHGMMVAVANVAQSNNISCQVSLEERMACGTKACMGCSIPTSKGMQKVCADGPVFESTEVINYEK